MWKADIERLQAKRNETKNEIPSRQSPLSCSSSCPSAAHLTSAHLHSSMCSSAILPDPNLSRLLVLYPTRSSIPTGWSVNTWSGLSNITPPPCSRHGHVLPTQDLRAVCEFRVRLSAERVVVREGLASGIRTAIVKCSLALPWLGISNAFPRRGGRTAVMKILEVTWDTERIHVLLARSRILRGIVRSRMLGISLGRGEGAVALRWVRVLIWPA